MLSLQMTGQKDTRQGEWEQFPWVRAKLALTHGNCSHSPPKHRWTGRFRKTVRVVRASWRNSCYSSTDYFFLISYELFQKRLWVKSTISIPLLLEGGVPKGRGGRWGKKTLFLWFIGVYCFTYHLPLRVEGVSEVIREHELHKLRK